jgi:hypothetical protein
MTEYENFLKKQEEVYSKFRNSPVRTEGIKPSPTIAQRQGGYIIALRHTREVTDTLGELSSRVAKIVPALTYGADNAHTTIVTYGVENDFIPDDHTLLKMARVLHKTPITNPLIDYREYLTNQDTVIATGIPDEGFLYIARNVVDNMKSDGIDVRPPWGSHITAARYTEPRRPEELTELFELLATAPVLGESRSLIVDVGYFHMNPQGFRFETYERFSTLFE